MTVVLSFLFLAAFWALTFWLIRRMFIRTFKFRIDDLREQRDGWEDKAATRWQVIKELKADKARLEASNEMYLQELQQLRNKN